MVGKIRFAVDNRPHCRNGWKGTRKRPACNYTGGHFCCFLQGHGGRCKCSCGAETTRKPPCEPKEEE